MKRRSRTTALLPLGCAALAAFLSLCLAGCAGVMDPQGPVAAQNKSILLDSLFIMLAIVVPTIGATLAFAFWFRAGNTRAKYMGDWEYSGQIEMVVWSIPAMVVLLLGGIGWIGSHDLDPPRRLPGKPTLPIQAVAMDWKWLFIYPTLGIASVNEVAIPTGTPIEFAVTSATVMNSFFIPQLGSQIYAMHGGANHVNLQADHDGTFRGMSAHFSGDGFSDMHFAVQSLPADAFGKWIAAARATPQALDRPTYVALLKPGTQPTPIRYRAVDPGLFDTIAYGDIRPGVAMGGPGVKGAH